MSFEHVSVRLKDVQPGRVVTMWNDTKGINQTSPQNRQIHKPVTLIADEVTKRGDVLMVTGTRAKDDGTPRARGVRATFVAASPQVLVQWNSTEEVSEV